MLKDIEQEIAAFTAGRGSRHGGGTRAIEGQASTTPVVRVVDLLIEEAVRVRASDVHIEPKGDSVRVRFRVDGALRDVVMLPGAMASGVGNRVKIMASMNISERRMPQDGQLTIQVHGRQVEIRVTSAGMNLGEKLVLRLADQSRTLSLGQLGMLDATLNSYRQMLQSPFGMIVCAGPTGSGKTTTMFATIDELNSPERNITTIEDPVEFVDPTLNQMGINSVIGLTYETCLRSILRQDPDVILVGEIRDVQTATLVIQATLTGHSVLTTVHAADAASALFRFVQMGIESFLLAATLLGIIGQRLVRQICPNCRVAYEPTPAELQYFTSRGGRVKQQYWMGRGCDECLQSGFSGRVGVFELLRLTPEMKSLIARPGISLEDIRVLARAQGMHAAMSEGIRLVEEDRTTIAEIIRTTYTAPD